MEETTSHYWYALIFVKLLNLTFIGVQDVCHEGLPDYPNVYDGNRFRGQGPETPNFAPHGENETNPGYGWLTQGVAMEVLSHVVYGGQQLVLPSLPTNAEYCSNFKPNCPHSLCEADGSTWWQKSSRKAPKARTKRYQLNMHI